MSSYCCWLKVYSLLSLKLSMLFSMIVPVIGRSWGAECSPDSLPPSLGTYCVAVISVLQKESWEKYQRSNRIPHPIREMSLLLPGSAQRLGLNHHQAALCITIQQMCQILLLVCMLQMFVFKLMKAWIHCAAQTYVKFRSQEFARDFLGLPAQFLLVMCSFVFLHHP